MERFRIYQYSQIKVLASAEELGQAGNLDPVRQLFEPPFCMVQVVGFVARYTVHLDQAYVQCRHRIPPWYIAVFARLRTGTP